MRVHILSCSSKDHDGTTRPGPLAPRMEGGDFHFRYPQWDQERHRISPFLAHRPAPGNFIETQAASAAAISRNPSLLSTSNSVSIKATLSRNMAGCRRRLEGRQANLPWRGTALRGSAKNRQQDLGCCGGKPTTVLHIKGARTRAPPILTSRFSRIGCLNVSAVCRMSTAKQAVNQKIWKPRGMLLKLASKVVVVEAGVESNWHCRARNLQRMELPDTYSACTGAVTQTSSRTRFVNLACRDSVYSLVARSNQNWSPPGDTCDGTLQILY